MDEQEKKWRKMKAILEDVLEASKEQRSKILAEKCGDDVQLKAEIEGLLGKDTEDHVLDKTLPLLTGYDFSTQSEAGFDESFSGRRIGNFELIRCIGEGGMGRVYEAVQDEPQLKRKVAVKLIKAGWNSKLLVQRFMREQQVLALQTHPNIARLLEGGVTDDGMPYFVMEYIDGEPVDAFCDKNKLTVNQRLLLFQKICDAVASAHRHLIIHRDLKPGNILVTPEGEPKLLDFGIAKPLDEELVEGGALTTPAARFITPEFAAPEQIQGKPVSTASDVYSLGVLLYYLLTGRMPLCRKSGESLLKWEQVVTEEEPEKPSTVVAKGDASKDQIAQCRRVSSGKLAKILRGDLDLIIAMAMRKEPERRYEAVGRLREDISCFLNGLPISAQLDSTGYRVRKFFLRHRMGVIAAFLTSMFLVVSVVGISIQAHRAQKEAEKAKTVVAFLKEMVASPNPYEGEGREVTVAEALERAAGTIEARFGEQPEIAAEIYSAIGSTFWSLGHYQSSETYLKSALDLLEELYNPPHFKLAEGAKELGTTRFYLGDYESASSLLKQSMAMFAELGDDRVSWQNALNEYGMVCMEQGSYEEAGKAFSEALAMARRLNGDGHQDVATITSNLAVNAHYLGDLDLAEILYRQVLDRLEVLHGKNHPDRATAFGNLAQVVIERNQYDEALSLLAQSLDIKRNLLGDNHAGVGLDYHNLAGVNYRKKAYGVALGYIEQALKVYGVVYPEDHTRIGQSLLLKGNILNEQGDYVEAERCIDGALIIFKKNLPSDHNLIAYAKSSMGVCLTGQNRYEEAEPLLLESDALLHQNQVSGIKYQRNVEGLIKLYESWGKEAKASRFREAL